MMEIGNKINEIYSFEQMAGGQTVIHRVNPLCKLFSALIFIVTAVSYERHDLGALLPLAFYPLILASLSETPLLLLLKRVVIALPFCLFVGLSNLILERQTAFFLGGLAVSYGALSFAVLLFRTAFCVMAVLLLMATTPFPDLTAALKRLYVPDIFITIFEITYRYIGVLFEEALSMRIAYVLRHSKAKGIEVKHAGSFVGCLLLKSFDRAERIYAAMKCRGYALYRRPTKEPSLRFSDLAYCVLVCGLCLLFRFTKVSPWLGAVVGGFFSC